MPILKEKFRQPAIRIEDLSAKSYSLLNDGITQSLLSDFMCCPRRFLLKVNRWRSPSEEETTFLGTIVHAALDRLFSIFKNEGRICTADELDIMMIKLSSERSFRRFLKNDFIDQQLCKAYVLVDHYIQRYSESFESVEIINPEEEFKINYHDILYKGKRDLLYTVKNGKIWMMEHKVRSRIVEESLLKKLTMDLQVLFYTLFSIREGYVNFGGIMYDLIRNPQNDIHKKETLEEYTERLDTIVSKDPDHYYPRYEISVTKKDLEYFEDELGEIVGRLQDCLTRDKWFRNTTACDTPFKCSYIDACSSHSLFGYYQSEQISPELS